MNSESSKVGLVESKNENMELKMSSIMNITQYGSFTGQNKNRTANYLRLGKTSLIAFELIEFFSTFYTQLQFNC